MKTLFFLVTLLFSSSAFSWGYGYGAGPAIYGPGFAGAYGPYGYAYPYGPYGMGGYGMIQAPSFNYNTVIQQSPPIIVNQQQPQVVYRDRYKPCDDECVRRYYSK